MTHGPEKDLLRDGRAFCMAPWVNLHVTAGGDVKPCCEADGAFANINDAPVRSLWADESFEAFRSTLRRDERDPRCWKCYDKEAAGGASLRQHFNEKFSHHADWALQAAPAGAEPAGRPVSWDIRFSNLCNFKCRSCWHGASSRWFADAVELGTAAGGTAVIRGVREPDRLLGELDQYAVDVEEVYFAGGEPLLMEEHYRILETLLRQGRHAVKLRYNTNLSELGYKDCDVLDLWSQFADVHVEASVDGIGARGELIRKGQSWQGFLRNREAIRNRCAHVRFGTRTTVSVMNLLHLPHLHRYLLERQIVEMERCAFTLLQEPPHYNIRILPRALKRKVAAQLRTHQTWIRQHAARGGATRGEADHQVHEIEKIVKFMNAGDWSEKVAKFAAVTRAVDRLRGERTEEVLPELRGLLSVGASRSPWTRLAHRAGLLLGKAQVRLGLSSAE